jgi:hypothetical protein
VMSVPASYALMASGGAYLGVHDTRERSPALTIAHVMPTVLPLAAATRA